MSDFDVDRFIAEVENRPAIWKLSSSEYANKHEKAKAWQEVCSIFYKDFDLKESYEKNEIYKTLQRKWKSLRDSFVRELNMQNFEIKSRAGRLNRRKYIYFEQLLFLRPIVTHRKSNANDEGSDHQEPDDAEKYVIGSECVQNEPQEDSQPTEFNSPAVVHPPARKRGLSQIDIAEVKLLNKMTHRMSKKSRDTSHQDSFDEDRLFLLSLLKDLKQIPDDNKLDAKTEIMHVLKKWRKTSYNTPTSQNLDREYQFDTERAPYFQKQSETVCPEKVFQPGGPGAQNLFHTEHIYHVTSTPQPGVSSPYPLCDSQDTT